MSARAGRRAAALLLTACAIGASGRLQAQGAARAGVVRGFVYDSVARQPLPAAIVQVMRLGAQAGADGRRTAVTDSAGRYEITGVPDGAFAIGFFHPKLDSLGIEAPVRHGTVPAHGVRAIDLAVPSAATVIAALCGRRALADSIALVAGYVLQPETGGPRENAVVGARWSEIVIGRGGARASTRVASTITSSTGWFGLCGIPIGALALLRVTSENDTGSYVEVEVPARGILLRPLYLGTHQASADRLARGRVSGVITGRDGVPVADARVRIWGSDFSVTTNDDGGYTLADVPVGTHTLEVRKIGFAPSRLAVDVLAASPAYADVSITEFPTEIDTVRVFARRALPAAAAPVGTFEFRRRQGFGTFLDADQIERRLPQHFTDLLRTIRGVHISTAGITAAVTMEGNSPDVACEPLIVLDGQRVPLSGMNINDLIPASVVRAIEVYPRRLEAPPEYQTLDCGTIVVWTGPRGWLAKRGKLPDG